MVLRKRTPQIYWSQTDAEVTLKIDLRLDDMVRRTFQIANNGFEFIERIYYFHRNQILK